MGKRKWQIARHNIKWMKMKERKPERISCSVKRHDNRPFAALGSSKSFDFSYVQRMSIRLVKVSFDEYVYA